MANYKFGINEPPHKRWPVAWYNPAVLFRSAREMVATANQIRNLDRRELFKSDFKTIDITAENTSDDFWWDFMSDSGDGGSATYTIARAMQDPELQIDGGEFVLPTTQLPRGKLLVLGGDLAYPGASTEEYQYRFIEMWEAARPLADDTRTLLAIPQNHDWFDNISSFNRHFIGNYENNILGADTPQNRSYFAARLPHNWWLLGLDFALVGDLDRAQFDAFVKLATCDIQPGDNAILLYPEPYWTRPLGDNARVGYPKRYQRLEALLLERGIKIRLRLAGDLHHYDRATATQGAGLDYEDMLVTCGSGGAFLHPTHAQCVTKPKIMDRAQETGAITPDLKNRTRVGTQDGTPTANQRTYQKSASYPDTKTSKDLSKHNIWALFKPISIKGVFSDTPKAGLIQRLKETWDWAFAGNIMLPISLGLLYWLAVYCNSFVFSTAFIENGFATASQIPNLAFPEFLQQWFKAFFFSPLALTVHLVIFAVCFSIALEDGWKSCVPGALHSTLQVLAVPTLFYLITLKESNPYMQGLWLVVGGILVGGLLFGLFFYLMSRAGLMANNAFSTLAHEGYKGFLRFRIDTDGNLHGYMIGTDSVPSEWVLNSNLERPLWAEKHLAQTPKWKVRDVFTLSK